MMRALDIYAGPKALDHLRQRGLQPQDVGTIPAAAGGPKGLILGPLDRFIFGHWLPTSTQTVHLVGASIGAWRMASACLADPLEAFERLERDYIAQHYELLPGEARPSAQRVSALFSANLQAFYGGRLNEVLAHPRYRLHILTSHGRGLLTRERGWPTALGYAGAFATNLVARRWLGAWLERVVFSSAATPLKPAELPFLPQDYPSRQVALTSENFQAALQASCSIPFVLQAVHDIAGAPPGAYWDGGVTDYHLHLNYAGDGVVLYPHFQRSVVPGWLDKHLPWRHGASSFLDNMVLLAPNPDWIKTLPNGKLPDRGDFTHYGADLAGRMVAWKKATAAAHQLADEFAQWMQRPDMARVRAL
jgi:hypothetical protein